MDAVENGAKSAERFRLHGPVHFEEITVDQYRVFGRTMAKRRYKSTDKQNEFMRGWYAVNQRFFHFMKGGPRRHVVSITVVCDLCGHEETTDVDDQGAAMAKYQPCPNCQKDEDE